MNQSKSLISIIIPVYNVGKYLEKALLSVINQTMTNIDIICVDDCSTDNSLEILQKFEKIDSRIKVLKHSKNLGVSCARNTGLAVVKTDYIMFLDPDDSYLPNICELMFEKMVSEDLDLVVCNVNIIMDLGMTYNRGYTNDRNYATVRSAWVWNKIWRKSILDKYKIKFPEGLLGEDAYFKNCYYVISSGKVGIIENKLYNYLIRQDSLMSAFDTLDNPVVFDCFSIGELTYKFFKEHGVLNQAYEHYFKSMGLGIKFLTEKNYDKIAKIVFTSLQTKPEIKIGKGCFVANGIEYIIEEKIVDRVKKLFKK